MDYDFSGLCGDQIMRLEKRLESLKKNFLKDYAIAMNVINNPSANEKRGEIRVQIDDLLNDVANKSSIFYTETLNKVQRVLKENL